MQRDAAGDALQDAGADAARSSTRALQRMRALPGVRGRGAIDDLPSQGGSVQPIVLEGHAELLPRDQPTVAVRKITPGYLRTMRDPAAARTRRRRRATSRSLLVSRAAAKLLWGDADPIGRRVTLPLQSKTVSKRSRRHRRRRQAGRAVGAAGRRRVYEYTRERDWSSLALVMRTSVPPLSLAQAAAGVDPRDRSGAAGRGRSARWRTCSTRR